MAKASGLRRHVKPGGGLLYRAPFKRTSSRCQRSSVWGRHEETLPASPWQSSSRGSEKVPVGTSKARPLDLSPKDTQLVAEHDDLEILGGLALAIWDQQPK